MAEGQRPVGEEGCIILECDVGLDDMRLSPRGEAGLSGSCGTVVRLWDGRSR